MSNWILSSSYKVIPSAWKIPLGRLGSLLPLNREVVGLQQLRHSPFLFPLCPCHPWLWQQCKRSQRMSSPVVFWLLQGDPTLSTVAQQTPACLLQDVTLPEGPAHPRTQGVLIVPTHHLPNPVRILPMASGIHFGVPRILVFPNNIQQLGKDLLRGTAISC